ncbi:MAG: UDP-glucose 4-epimerase GalE [Anaerolineae bacterium]|jgi:UDP-glucose 4-epimerase|nr:UDP-glucose 4-epimerase GalE [Anaerolineae bacterium]
MKVLVTGGAGYIGSHVVYRLVEQGHQPVVFDNLIAGHRQAVHPAAAFVQGDLLDAEAIRALFAQHGAFDGIMHFASHIQVGESMKNPFKYLRDNVLAMTNLLEVATANGVGRFILSSTANLYDNPTRVPIPEDEPLIPGSVYGETKFIGERLLMWMERIYGLRYACLRYFNASGAHPEGVIGEDHRPETHLIPLILQVALGQRAHIDVFGTDYDTPDGTCIRDYVHVMDLADAHILALQALSDGRSRTYNLGSGAGYSVLEAIETVRRVTGHPIPVQTGARRAGDLARLVADSSKIKAELGWQPRYGDLQSIVETAWRWHQSHPHGYEG